MHPLRVLFVCTGNTCRSPMAAGLFRTLAAKHPAFAGRALHVSSAGTAASEGAPAAALAVEAMRAKGIDISDHRARSFKDDGEPYDLILTMTEEHKAQVLLRRPECAANIYTLKEYAGISGSKDIPDPFGLGSEAYRRAIDEIESAVRGAIERLAAERGKR